ncbi:MAG: DUF1501 domain-containing protein [Acidobacteria bacterium]|nr:DUF1501 domain-containing protein [Acidobacteriota bacterium]
MRFPGNGFTRRELLRLAGTGFGTVGFTRLLAETAPSPGPLAVKPPHFPAKATRVIHLFLNGGYSQVDTFDPKPMLEKYDGKPYPGKIDTERKEGNLMRSPFKFAKYGQSGLEVCECFPKLGAMIDELCVVRSCYTDLPIHEPALFLMNCGNRLPGHPSMGSWITYGLGTENQNLPGYVVLSPGAPQAGPQLWSSGFLPGAYQGTQIQNTETDPTKLVPFVKNARLSPIEQRLQVELLSKLNRTNLTQNGPAPELEASIHSMETAYRMQAEALDAFDINKETEKTRERYGNTPFGQGCLMARRLAERGVRIVQVYFGKGSPWDHHDDILQMRDTARVADQAIPALLQDLKDRGLFGETLVIIAGEFGRTPTVQIGGPIQLISGRDHSPMGFTTLLAGGGVKGGIAYGATDDFGVKAVENAVHVHDLHATILHQLGLDHKRLTYRYSGRDFRLTDVAGEVVRAILA